jgi:hypothetical protein
MATLWIHGGFPVVRVLSELTFGYLFYNFFERKPWFFSGFSRGIQGVPVGFPSSQSQDGIGSQLHRKSGEHFRAMKVILP